MRLIICLLVLSFGFCDIYAGGGAADTTQVVIVKHHVRASLLTELQDLNVLLERKGLKVEEAQCALKAFSESVGAQLAACLEDEARFEFDPAPQYWKLLEGSSNELNSDTDPEIITQNIAYLLKADIQKFYQSCESSEEADRLQPEKYTEIGSHFSLVLRQLQDMDFLSKRGQVVCSGLRELLWDVIDWQNLEVFIVQTQTWNSRQTMALCALRYLWMAACEKVMKALDPSSEKYRQLGTVREDSEDFISFVNLSLDLACFSDEAECDQKRMDEFVVDVLDILTPETIIRLMSFRCMQSAGRSYRAPSNKIFKRLLPRLEVADLEFFLAHATDDKCLSQLEFEYDKRTGIDAALRTKILQKNAIQDVQKKRCISDQSC